MKAEMKFAAWNCQYGVANMPATSDTEARSGPKNRPIMIANAPHCFTNRSPRGMSSGCRDNGHICATAGPSLRPTQ
jgi:hypothetical protein